MTVRIKFCGFTRAEDIDTAMQLDVDEIGVVHYFASRRHVSLIEMPALRVAVPKHKKLIALFVNPRVEEAHAVIQFLRPNCLQFHGNESNEFCQQFNLPFIKAIAMAGEQPDIIELSARYPDANAFLLDGHKPGEMGGQGQRFNWNQRIESNKEIYLAGGLTSENVSNAIKAMKPNAVDVSSGIELAPGIKDAKKMWDFVRAVRAIHG